VTVQYRTVHVVEGWDRMGWDGQLGYKVKSEKEAVSNESR